jgi:deaminated glutathione amidase
MIVDPWGVILVRIDDGEGIAVADLDLDRLAEIRAQLPALTHRHRALGGD